MNPLSGQQQLLGIIYILIASVGFASQGILIKFAYAEHVSIMAILLLRKFMFLPLCIFFSQKGDAREKKGDMDAKTKIYSMIAGIFGYYLTPLFSLHALTYIDAGVERILLYCFPALVIILQSVIDRRFPPLSYVLVFLLMQYGIFLTMKSLHFTGDGIIGAWWALGAALAFAINVVFNQALVKRMGSPLFILYSLYGATAAILCHFLITEPFSSLNLTPIAWFYIVIFAIFSTFIPSYMFSEGVKRIGGSRASLISMVCPAATVVFAYIFLHEVLTPVQLAGGSIILMGIVFLEASAIFRRKTAAPV